MFLYRPTGVECTCKLSTLLEYTCFSLICPIHLCARLVSEIEHDFFDVVGCYKITTVFSHAQTVVLCVGCSTLLCQPTGGKARLTEGRRAFDYWVSWLMFNE